MMRVTGSILGRISFCFVLASANRAMLSGSAAMSAPGCRALNGYGQRWTTRTPRQWPLLSMESVCCHKQTQAAPQLPHATYPSRPSPAAPWTTSWRPEWRSTIATARCRASLAPRPPNSPITVSRCAGSYWPGWPAPCAVSAIAAGPATGPTTSIATSPCVRPMSRSAPTSRGVSGRRTQSGLPAAAKRSPGDRQTSGQHKKAGDTPAP